MNRNERNKLNKSVINSFKERIQTLSDDEVYELNNIINLSLGYTFIKNIFLGKLK